MAGRKPRSRPTPRRREQSPIRRQGATTTWWHRARVGITLIEIIAVARGDVALACGARATALLGDTVFGTVQNP